MAIMQLVNSLATPANALSTTLMAPGPMASLELSHSNNPVGDLEIYHVLEALPEDAKALLPAPDRDLFSSRLWYEVILSYGLPSGFVPCFALGVTHGKPYALLALQSRVDGRAMQSLTNPYTCVFQPIIRSEREARNAGRLVAKFCRMVGTMRLEALDSEMPGLSGFIEGLRNGGIVARPYSHFGNWYERVRGASFDAYLAARPGELRSTLRRKMRRLEAATTLDVIRSAEGLERGIAGYEAVYALSWKPSEPFPQFNAALMRAAAKEGILRLGILRMNDKPIASQFWIVSGERAMVLKLAHDPGFDDHSPGTVLTALMIRDIFGSDHVSEIDFGRGDDPYKQLWTSRRRQRIGLMLANPRRPAGLAEIGRSWLAGGRRRFLNSIPLKRA